MEGHAPATLTAADIRALLARRRMRLHRLAARVDLHPVHLGLVLNERRPLSPALAARIQQVLDEGAPAS